MKGPNGYRLVAAIISAYLAVYWIIEAQHVRQATEATTARNALIDLASSGHRGAFVSAMAEFGPIQNMSVIKEPSIFPFPSWWTKSKPNERPLNLWAINRLKICVPKECGIPQKYRIYREYDITLHWANLHEATLKDVDMSNSNIGFANMAKADLTCANLENSYLRGVDLTKSSLKRTNLRSAQLACAQPRPDPDGERDAQCTDLTGADLTGADLTGADLTRAILLRTNLANADLRGVKGLDCDQLANSKDWGLSCRSHELMCGVGNQFSLACNPSSEKKSSSKGSFCRAFNRQ